MFSSFLATDFSLGYLPRNDFNFDIAVFLFKENTRSR